VGERGGDGREGGREEGEGTGGSEGEHTLEEGNPRVPVD
jgi:hypothetical protein